MLVGRSVAPSLCSIGKRSLKLFNNFHQESKTVPPQNFFSQTGSSRSPPSGPTVKNFSFFFSENVHIGAVPPRQEGRFGRSSPDVGRDAMDAMVSARKSCADE